MTKKTQGYAADYLNRKEACLRTVINSNGQTTSCTDNFRGKPGTLYILKSDVIDLKFNEIFLDFDNFIEDERLIEEKSYLKIKSTDEYSYWLINSHYRILKIIREIWPKCFEQDSLCRILYMFYRSGWYDVFCNVYPAYSIGECRFTTSFHIKTTANDMRGFARTCTRRAISRNIRAGRTPKTALLYLVRTQFNLVFPLKPTFSEVHPTSD